MSRPSGSQGVYLQLFHGRKDPAQDMDDWGEEGPTLGPLRYVHGTYGCDLKFAFLHRADARAQGFAQQEGHIAYHGDLLLHDGWYYGDFTVFTKDPDAAV